MDSMDDDSEHFDFQVPKVDLHDMTNDNFMEESMNSESTYSDNETDFAKQLRRQRKQVLVEKGAKPAKPPKDFSQVLRQHREVLVETWGEHTHKTSSSISPPMQDSDSSHVAYIGDVSADGDMLPETKAIGGTDALMTALDAISFESHDQTMSFDTADLPPDTPSRALDNLLAVTPNPSGAEAMPDSELHGSQPNDSTAEHQMEDALVATARQAASADDDVDDDDDDDDFFGGFSTTLIQDKTNDLSGDTQNHVDTANGDLPQIREIFPDTAESPSSQPTVAAPKASDDFHTGSAGSSQSQAPTPTNDTESFEDCKASTFQSPVSIISNNGDDFKDVNDAPCNMAVSIESRSDADFGIFNATMSHPSTPSVNYEGDDFGGFDAASSQPPVPTVANDDDDFGDFDAQPSQPAVPTLSNDDQDFEKFDTYDDFSNIDAASSQVPAATVSHDVEDEDEFGEFDAAHSQPLASKSNCNDSVNLDVTPPQPPNSDTNDGDFGNIDAAASQIPTVAISHDDEDEFGEFDAAPSQPPATKSNGNDSMNLDVTPPQPPNSDTYDGDFGNIDAAASQIQTVAISHDDDDDEFGEFDAAPSQPPAVAKNDVDDDFGNFDMATSQLPTSNINNDDEFGDFDVAPVQQKPAAINTNDDTFGDFDASQSQPPADTTTDVDDQFRDFDAALSHSTSPPLIDDDDDFGDFDAAPSQLQSASPIDGDGDGDGDGDDDFGDFDAAPEKPRSPSNSDGENFGNFDPVLTVSQSEVSQASELNQTAVTAPKLEAAKLLLSRLKHRYPFAELDSESHEVPPAASLTEVMTSIEPTGRTGELPMTATLVQWLLGIDKTRKNSPATPKLIIQNDGRNPYYQFGSPIGGLPISEEDIKQQQSDRRVSVTCTDVPDLLPIHLPSSEDNPLSVTSPKSKKKTESKLFGMNGAVHPTIPNLENSINSSQSDAVRQLIDKIPDLSFMLESKLILPHSR